MLKNRITDAIESQSVLGNKKPNLIVIDEIDGASGGYNEASFIKALVDLVLEGERSGPGGNFGGPGGRRPQRPESSSAEDDDPVDKAAKRSVKAAKHRLLRPIICICNDLYAPSLRPLRMIAQILHFRKPTAASMVKRLKMICDKEGLRIDNKVLTVLCERSDFDIRTCLNVLQFLRRKLLSDADSSRTGSHSLSSSSSKNKRPLLPAITMAMLNEVNIGHKDMQKSIFAAWEKLFKHTGLSSTTFGQTASNSNSGTVLKVYIDQRRY